jgi:hypothetical protein
MEVRSFADSANMPADTTKMILRTRWLKLHCSIADVSCVMEQSPWSFRSLSYRRRLPADKDRPLLVGQPSARSSKLLLRPTITESELHCVDRQTVLRLSKYSGHCSASRLCLLSGKMVCIERLVDKAREMLFVLFSLHTSLGFWKYGPLRPQH